MTHLVDSLTESFMAQPWPRRSLIRQPACGQLVLPFPITVRIRSQECPRLQLEMSWSLVLRAKTLLTIIPQLVGGHFTTHPPIRGAQRCTWVAKSTVGRCRWEAVLLLSPYRTAACC